MRSSPVPPSKKSRCVSLKPGRTAAPLQAQDLAIASDTEDLIAANRDSFSHRALLGGRIDSRVVDDEVHRAVAVVSLGADDQPGDERDRNDGDNDECSKTGRHFDLRFGESMRRGLLCILVDRLRDLQRGGGGPPGDRRGPAPCYSARS